MSTRVWSTSVLALSLLGSTGAAAAPGAGQAAPAAAAPGRPKLVVFLAVDQMRGDYYDWYGKGWSKGLKRLFEKGAWFKNAAYPYLNTVTCAGHATLGTGAYPRTHGMVLNGWYDRDRKKVIECTDDPMSPLLAYPPFPGVNPRLDKGDSAKNLRAPTIGDELQAQLSPRPRVVAFSMKARSSIEMAGHRPDVALWFEQSTWVTSSAFTKRPLPWLAAFIQANPGDIETPWKKLLPDRAYKFEDDSPVERPPHRWSKAFPHDLKDPGSKAASYGRWGGTPAADEYLGKLARTALTEMKLGQGPQTDYLAVSFSITDVVGHSFGPHSHEVQDVLLRLDGTLGQLLDAIDAQVGKENWVLGFSADHGVALVPERAKGEGMDAGRISGSDLKKKVAEAIEKAIGVKGAVVELQGNDLYLAPGVHDQLAAKPAALAQVLAAARAVPGIADAFDRGEIGDPARAKDEVRRAAALTYFPGRSGDILVAPKPNWIFGSVGTGHGSTNGYDQHVPVVLYGAGIRPGRYDRKVSPADIAPTLAKLVGVTMTKAEGKVLDEALAGGAPVQARAKRRR